MSEKKPTKAENAKHVDSTHDKYIKRLRALITEYEKKIGDDMENCSPRTRDVLKRTSKKCTIPEDISK